MNTILLLLVAAALSLWYNGARAKENAIRRVADTLAEADLQLLDGSIYLRKLLPTRARSGRVCLLRFYAFEYTANGADRHFGFVVMAADKMEYLQIEKDGHAIITTGEEAR